MRIFNRFGLAEYIEWSYNPEENLNAKEKAYVKLVELGIENAVVYEVAPVAFWYRLNDGSINCSIY